MELSNETLSTNYKVIQRILCIVHRWLLFLLLRLSFPPVNPIFPQNPPSPFNNTQPLLQHHPLPSPFSPPSHTPKQRLPQTQVRIPRSIDTLFFLWMLEGLLFLVPLCKYIHLFYYLIILDNTHYEHHPMFKSMLLKWCCSEIYQLFELYSIISMVPKINQHSIIFVHIYINYQPNPKT